jgi:lysophospholipase L1-like esterase
MSSEPKLSEYKLKYCALGDSITYGFIPRNYPGYPGQLKSYAALAAEKLQQILNTEVEFYNHGISDSCIANLEGHDPMCIRYAQMPDDADIITVMGGTNDVRCGVPLGQMSDRCNTTFYGALHTLCQGLYSKYIGDVDPTVGAKRRIILLTPPKLLDADKSSLPNTPENNANVLYSWDKWIAAIKEVAAFYSFQVIDIHNLSGVNPHLCRTVKGWQDGYLGNYNPYITDGTHPTQEGSEMIARLLVRELGI